MGLHDVDHPDGVVQVALGESADFEFDTGVGSLLKRTYLLESPMLTNTTSESIDPLIQFTALCGKIVVLGGLLDENICALDKTFRTTDLVDLPVYDRRFALGGFSQVSFDVDPGGATVPEPATLALLSLGLAGLGFSRRKRAS